MAFQITVFVLLLLAVILTATSLIYAKNNKTLRKQFILSSIFLSMPLWAIIYCVYALVVGFVEITENNANGAEISQLSNHISLALLPVLISKFLFILGLIMFAKAIIKKKKRNLCF